MKVRINQTRTILLLLVDKEINDSFSYSKHSLKINSKDTKEISQQYTDLLVVSFTNPIDTNSNIQQNKSSSSLQFLLLRKSRTHFTQKISENQFIFNKKSSLSKMKFRLKSLHEEQKDILTDKGIKLSKRKEAYYKGYNYLFNLVKSFLPSNENLYNDNADNNEDLNDNYYSKTENMLINNEIKQYVYNEDYDSENDSSSIENNQNEITSIPKLIVLHPMN